MARGSWAAVVADTDLVFDDDFDAKWQRAVSKIGIDLTMPSTDAGRA